MHSLGSHVTSSGHQAAGAACCPTNPTKPQPPQVPHQVSPAARATVPRPVLALALQSCPSQAASPESRSRRLPAVVAQGCGPWLAHCPQRRFPRATLQRPPGGLLLVPRPLPPPSQTARLGGGPRGCPLAPSMPLACPATAVRWRTQTRPALWLAGSWKVQRGSAPGSGPAPSKARGCAAAGQPPAHPHLRSCRCWPHGYRRLCHCGQDRRRPAQHKSKMGTSGARASQRHPWHAGL